jgi:hypothetical protein
LKISVRFLCTSTFGFFFGSIGKRFSCKWNRAVSAKADETSYR